MEMILFKILVSHPFLHAINLAFLKLKVSLKRAVFYLALSTLGSLVLTALPFLLGASQAAAEKLAIASTILPPLICSFLLSEYKGFRFFFSFSLELTLACVCGFLSSIAAHYVSPGGFQVQLAIRATLYCLAIGLGWRAIRPSLMRAFDGQKKGWGIVSILEIVFFLTVACYSFVLPQTPDSPDKIVTVFGPYIYERYLLPSCLLLLFVGFAYAVVIRLFLLSRQLSEEQEEARQLSLQAQALEGQCQIYAASHEQVRILRHDMRHHIVTLSALLESDQYSEIKSYLSALGDVLEHAAVAEYCDNSIVNSILSVYAQKSKEAGIAFEVHAAVPYQLSVDATELGVVLSNALENAVQACGKLSDGIPKKIRFLFKSMERMLIFEISNPYEGTVAINRQGYPVSQQAGHGYGSRSIAAFTRKYQAIIDYQTENGQFQLRMMIPTGT